MGKFNKISQDTFKQLQLEAGILLKNFDPTTAAAPQDSAIICATTGGISASCVATYSDMGEDIDNCPNNTKELKHLDSWECKISFTALSVTEDTIKLALGAANVTSAQHKIAPRSVIKAEDFATVWWVGDRSDGGLVAIKLMNALSTGGFSLKTEKNGKGQLTVELTGHVSIDDTDTVPMEFYAAPPKTT